MAEAIPDSLVDEIAIATGMTPDERVATLRQAYSDATLRGVRTAWESPVELPPVF